jgi:hypothetical protein
LKYIGNSTLHLPRVLFLYLMVKLLEFQTKTFCLSCRCVLKYMLNAKCFIYIYIYTCTVYIWPKVLQHVKKSLYNNCMLTITLQMLFKQLEGNVTCTCTMQVELLFLAQSLLTLYIKDITCTVCGQKYCNM